MALATQVPLTALMVVYTFVGLSITAEPIVESRHAAEPAAVASEAVAIPADAVLPDARSGDLRAVGPDKSARLKLTYKVLGSAFHDGTQDRARPICSMPTRSPIAGALEAHGERRRLRSLSSMPRPRPCAGISLGVRVVGVDAGSKSFRVGDVNFVREIFTVEVYLARRAGGAGMERGGGAAVEHAALARAGPDGGGGDARLGGVLAGARRRGAASRGSISCAQAR